MSNFYVSIFQIRGSSYHIGLETGVKLRNTTFVNTLESITKQEIDLPNMKSIYSTFAPHLLEELDGLAQGSGISETRASALFSGYDVPKT
jgi:predicted choloylglycine hydrolase